MSQVTLAWGGGISGVTSLGYWSCVQIPQNIHGTWAVGDLVPGTYTVPQMTHGPTGQNHNGYPGRGENGADGRQGPFCTLAPLISPPQPQWKVLRPLGALFMRRAQAGMNPRE